MKKTIIHSTTLPQCLQTEMQAMGVALEKRYGKAAHFVGSFAANIATLCDLLKSELTADERTIAYDCGREMCSEAIMALARALHVESEAVLAVAKAYQDFTVHAEGEILGVEQLADTKDEAVAAILKAAQS
jgi:hypothetical protein